MTELELGNCPFCGFDSPTMRIYKGKDGWRDRYTVVCRYDEGGCGAEGGMYHSAAEAAEAWNRRSDIEKDPAVENWISSSERLPNEAGEYFVCGRWPGEKPRAWICKYIIFGNIGGFVNSAKNPPVSFWMPLPEPPDGDEKW